MKIKLHITTIRTVVLIAAFSLLAGGIGYGFGKRDLKGAFGGESELSVINTEVPAERDIDFSLFWDVWKRLEANYLEKEKIDSQEMVWGAIQGMTKALGDPYTVFLPPSDNEKTREDLNGTFEGIGAQLGMKDEQVVVIAPLKGMPAETAGIEAGDIILAVDKESTYGWSVPEAVEKIRGPKGEKVTLTIIREGLDAPIDIDITRDTIEIPTVEVEYKNNTAILKLYQFGEQTNHQWEDAVEDIVKNCVANRVFTCKGVVLDVRNNPGGYLDGAVFISSEFLADGVVVIQEYGNGRRDEFKVNRRGRLLKVPTVVLVNKGSASASEIVAGALKVRGRATVVGDISFGKGTIQEREELPQGAGLHITTAKWLLPDGSWINGVGLVPDIEISDNQETLEIDEQLDRAIQVLLE